MDTRHILGTLSEGLLVGRDEEDGGTEGEGGETEEESDIEEVEDPGIDSEFLVG